MTGRGIAVHDRGLRAVRRVRAVRERDSKVGLQQALGAARDREAEAAAMAERLTGLPAFGAGSGADFGVHAAHVTGLAAEHRRRVAAAEQSRRVADEAARRWVQDRQALEVVDQLLERRTRQRREEQDRAGARDLDELAGQRWLAQQSTAGGEGR